MPFKLECCFLATQVPTKIGMRWCKQVLDHLSPCPPLYYNCLSLLYSRFSPWHRPYSCLDPSMLSRCTLCLALSWEYFLSKFSFSGGSVFQSKSSCMIILCCWFPPNMPIVQHALHQRAHVNSSSSSRNRSLHVYSRCNAASLRWTVCVDQRGGERPLGESVQYTSVLVCAFVCLFVFSAAFTLSGLSLLGLGLDRLKSSLMNFASCCRCMAFLLG